ncbi:MULTISPECIES: GmrSD restriction endonuclease domain-containing protein [Cyanophyceae]|uniref:DUF262 domain-containing protein n=1 Tax=Stenomitos frigidus AS-A4 TaxID=2933935 RepID=A0ABV0KKH1_9CYAN
MSIYTDRIQPTHSGISTYLENLLSKKYQIPTFQRNVVWERENVKKLWDSIYKFYPLGSILVWKTDVKLQSHREIGGTLLPENHTSNEYQYILDGQQRTTSLLSSLYGGTIVGKGKFDPTVYVDLTIEHQDITDNESYKKRFLFWDEIDDREGQLLANSGKKKRYDEGLIVKLEDIRMSFGSLERKLNNAGYVDFDHPYRAELRKIKEVLDNYRISFIELKGIQVAEVCQIFERINQAGKPLNIFDIVVAKTFRPEGKDEKPKGFYLRDLFDDYRKSIAGSHFANLSEMALLEILAVIISNNISESGIKNITDRYLNEIRTEQIEEVWHDAKKAISKVIHFFDKVLKIRGPSLVPYRYFYLTLAVYFYQNSEPNYSFLERYFWYYSFHNNDLLSNTTHLWQHIGFLKKQKDQKDDSFAKFLIDRNSLRNSSYSSRGRLSRAILSLYANQEPKDWSSPHCSVIDSIYYFLTDQPNLHHIFPLSFVEKGGVSSAVHSNSLMNIAYLTQITNLKISDSNPLDYLKVYDTNDFGQVLATHLIPTEILEWSRLGSMPHNALQIFVEERVDLLIETLKQKLEGITFDVIDTQSPQET